MNEKLTRHGRKYDVNCSRVRHEDIRGQVKSMEENTAAGLISTVSKSDDGVYKSQDKTKVPSEVSRSSSYRTQCKPHAMYASDSSAITKVINRPKIQTSLYKPTRAVPKKKMNSSYTKQTLQPSKATVTYIDDKFRIIEEPMISNETIKPINLPVVLQSQPNTQRNKVASKGNSNMYVEKTERSKVKTNMGELLKQYTKEKTNEQAGKDAQRKKNGKVILPNSTLNETPPKDYQMETNKGSFNIVAAIDFGTTFSGYAFQTTFEHASNSLAITAKLWSSPHFNSVKTSSAILFDPTKKFHSFGFEAEEKFLRLLEDEDGCAESWYYFTGFKMILYQNTNLNNNTKLKDHNGKKMSALKVFSAAIGYLKADLLGFYQQMYAQISLDKIRWVISVPALWNDKAKTFMREAARKAGVPGDSLIMALEPEAASLYCIEWMKRSDATELGRKEKFLVLDAGGGTVDIAVHQIQENGKIKELHKANGGDWGGIKVDQEFKKLLKDIVGKEVVEELEKYHIAEFIDIFHSFERAKRRDFSIVAHGKVQVTCPSIVNQLCLSIRHRDINHLVTEDVRLKGNVRLVKNNLEIDHALFKSLFQSAIRDVLNHMTSLLRHAQVRDITTVFMVGGYSECYLLQEAIRSKFNNLNVLVPPNAVLSILKGAVLYGHSPRTFQSRISTFTYGIETTEPFEKHHPMDKKICINGAYHCDKVFCIHVRDGENVSIGKSVSKLYKTIDPKQTHMEFIVYASTASSPKFTDEKGCFQLGMLTVDVSKMSVDRYGVKKVRLELIYGGTELEAIATDTATGKTSREHFSLKQRPD